MTTRDINIIAAHRRAEKEAQRRMMLLMAGVLLVAFACGVQIGFVWGRW